MTRRRLAAAAVGTLLLAACDLLPSESASPSAATPPPAESRSASASPSASAPASPSDAPSAPASPTPEPSLSLALPETSDDRIVRVTVAPDLDADGGTLLVTVTSAADERIDELVLRWPRELESQLRLAPFAPSEERIREGGEPLVQPWTKWVVGPGEEGEPDGTISVGWGPLLPGATLEIPLLATRSSDAPVAFDLQLLSDNDLLTLQGGKPAELRVEIP